jgi:hypothetical protein
VNGIFTIPPENLTTIPSGSTWLIVAFLYSFPLTVLKSSASAIDAKLTIKTTNVGVLILATLPFSGDIKAKAIVGDYFPVYVPTLEYG